MFRDEFTANVLPYFNNVIISPGPGRPERSSDFGICTQLLQAQLDPQQSEYHRPIFGVCLGHQGIGHLLGGKVIYAPRIMHGRMSQVHHNAPHQTEYNDILNDCPSPFWAVRYHSLVVDKDCKNKFLHFRKSDCLIRFLLFVLFSSSRRFDHYRFLL